MIRHDYERQSLSMTRLLLAAHRVYNQTTTLEFVKKSPSTCCC